MLKTLIISLSLLFIGAGGSWVSAAITERVIYAGDTPLASDCRVMQTGPMELTIMPCFWTTTGEARIFSAWQSIRAWIDNGPLAEAISTGRAEWMPDGRRIRGWLTDKQGNIIERSKTYWVVPKAVLTIVAGQKYIVYMLKGLGQTMNIALMNPSDPSPETVINYLIFKFDVPAGTTDLSTITLEVFTVRPNLPPRKGLFEK